MVGWLHIRYLKSGQDTTTKNTKRDAVQMQENDKCKSKQASRNQKTQSSKQPPSRSHMQTPHKEQTPDENTARGKKEKEHPQSKTIDANGDYEKGRVGNKQRVSSKLAVILRELLSPTCRGNTHYPPYLALTL